MSRIFIILTSKFMKIQRLLHWNDRRKLNIPYGCVCEAHDFGSLFALGLFNFSRSLSLARMPIFFLPSFQRLHSICHPLSFSFFPSPIRPLSLRLYSLFICSSLYLYLFLFATYSPFRSSFILCDICFNSTNKRKSCNS